MRPFSVRWRGKWFIGYVDAKDAFLEVVFERSTSRFEF